MAKTLTVLTPWYPAPGTPFAGAFVEAHVEAVAPLVDKIEVVHAQAWGVPVKRGSWNLPVPQLVHRMLRRRFRQVVKLMEEPFPVAGTHGLRRIPVMVNPDGSFYNMARNFTDYLRMGLPGGRLQGDVVHAHVGLRGGWSAVELAKPGARVFVTEHATYLDKVFAQPDSRKLYESVIRRCTGFFCVSEVLRSRLVQEFPQHAGKFSILPNPIPFQEITARPGQPNELRRWLFAGYLNERKGVRQLIEAFAECYHGGDADTLTIVGEGKQLTELTRRAAALGVDGKVEFLGGLPRHQVLAQMREHDLLVHASSYETFGMTIVEAIASGTPVLVTDCGGPGETLAGIDRLAGALVPLSADGAVEPAALVAGFRELAARLDGLDLRRAREELAARYSYQAVAAKAAEHYFPQDASRESMP